MTSSVASPVIQPGSFSLNPEPDPGFQDQLIYTVTPAGPERIESVNFTAVYAGNTPGQDQYAIILQAQNGDVVDFIAAPVIKNPDAEPLTAHLAWFRRGGDTANTPLVDSDPFNFAGRQVFATMSLPDLVLQASSTVTLRLYGNVTAEEPPITITDCTLTTTRNAGAVSSTIQVIPLPLLTPTDDG